MTVFVANTNVVNLLGLKNPTDDTFINDATVSVTIKKNGVEVEGETWPLSMTYVDGSDGNYRGIVSADLDLVDRKYYVAIVDATTAGLAGHWEFPFRAATRTTE